MADPQVIRIESPVDGSFVGEVPCAGTDDVRAAVARARVAQATWAKRPVAERCELLLAIRERVLARKDDFVALLARESGKPRHEALMHEVFAPLELLTYFAAEAERILAPTPIPMRLLKHRASRLHYVPRGVVGIIGPWNFPHNIPFGGAAMAIVAGNAAVIKPSESTPLIAELALEVWREAGVPRDLVQLVHGRGDVGAALIDAGVDMVEFTGSVATGRKVGAMCGERVIPCVLELGGKAPALVLEDADPGRALHACTWGGFANAGQVCASIERLLVHERVAERFVPAYVERVKALRVGSAIESADIDVGPLVNRRQLEIVEARVADAVAKGARVLCGGHRVEGLSIGAGGNGLFYAPTVLDGVTPDMDVVNLETFGPVVPIQRFTDEDAMVAEANRSHLGLLAYVFSRDPERANRVAERVEAGTVMINDVIAAHAMAETPWAGIKQSGIGSTHGDDALRHMCQQRHVNEDVLPWMERELWWYPYRSADLPMLERSIRGLYASGVWGKLRGLVGGR